MAPPDSFEQKIPGSLASFRVVRVPDGQVTLRGQTYQIKGLQIAETEITWDVFDIWAFRLDQTEQEQAQGVDAASRPSKPYGAPDKGFGHAGYAALGMTHHAAEAFCRWLSAKTGRKYRLPTEAEWVYAAKANSPAPTDLAKVAWYWDNAEDVAHAVGSKEPNAFGLRDMLGNLAEWVNAAEKPVAMGGHFMSKAPEVTAESRLEQTPKWNENDPQNPKSKWWLSSAPFIGFRVVCETRAE